jgi:hypothetical protein
MAYTDAEVLAFVSDEKKRSIGFSINANSAELVADRERALNYIKGDVSQDVPSLPNRSSVVSTDVADTIETWLSDMVEILAGGEDVVTFRPNGPQDEASARQETDYVNHVFFNENAGFMTLYTMLKDAGQTKTGVVTWWEEACPEVEPTHFEGLTEAALGLISSQDTDEYTIENVRPSEQQGPPQMDPMTGQPIPTQLFDADIVPKPRKRARVAAVPPEDFSVAADTVRLAETTYCAMKSRPRAQDLIADGVDPDIVDQIAPFGSSTDIEVLARDTAGEHTGGINQGGNGELRQVEITKHYIRLVDVPEAKPRIWMVRTSNDDALLIDKEEVDEIPFAAITPYPVTHRFYGESIADKTMEPQKIRTSLTRIALDSAYFAQNQRMEVAEDQSSDNTIPDLLRNEPGMPIRSKSGNAVRPVQAGSLGFDPFNALEYFATVVEARTGVVRNAQGLNPDTLHDTASGAGMLATAAQKRVRLMARIFAETGIKDLYLGLHALLRRIGGMTDTIRLNGQWQNIDPTKWGQRDDMTVEVGVGSSGKAQDMAMLGMIIEKQAQAVQMQGGATGPLVNLANLYASAIRLTQKAGFKDAETFWTDPAQQQPQKPPTPEQQAQMADAQNDQAKVQIDQGKLALEQQAQQAKAQAEQTKLELEQQKHVIGAQFDAAKIEIDQRRIALDEQKLQLDIRERDRAHQIAMAKIELEARHARDKLDSENALKLAAINAQYQTSVTVASIKSDAEEFRAHADVAMQAAEHQHAHALAEQEHAHGLEQTTLAADLHREPVTEAEADEVEDDEK